MSTPIRPAERERWPWSWEGAEAALQAIWKYPSFRPFQHPPLKALLARKDVLAVLPTGGGKSLLYQVPALLGKGMTLVISPLIALMHDQVDALAARGIPAAVVDSTLTSREVEQVLLNARAGAYRLLYCSPERLQTEVFKSLAPEMPISLIAVDEAHCVSEWGLHFRPAYRAIGQARMMWPKVPLLAVTATAPPQVRNDIREFLALRDPEVCVLGFQRDNLALHVRRTDNKQTAILKAIRSVTEGALIVYAATRRTVEHWHAVLSREGIACGYYHGGLDAEARNRAQSRWLLGETPVLVATNAFGMGIDKPDVRLVLHVEVPANIEAYYQEAGRAGRDGKPCHALMVWHPADLNTQRTLMERAYPDDKLIQKVFDLAAEEGKVALGEVSEGPVLVSLVALAKRAESRPPLVFRALEVLQEHGYLKMITEGDGSLRWVLSIEDLRAWASRQSPSVTQFVAALVRALPVDSFRDEVPVTVAILAKKVSLPEARLLKGFAYLEQQGLLRWVSGKDALRIHILVPRSRKVPLETTLARKAKAIAEQRLREMERYLNIATCRQQFILHYFGQGGDACGRCDLCRARRDAKPVTPADERNLRHLVKELAHQPLTEITYPEPDRLPAVIDYLVREEIIVLEDPFTQRFKVQRDLPGGLRGGSHTGNAR